MRRNKIIMYSVFSVFTLIFFLLFIVCTNDLRNYFEREEEYKKTIAVVTDIEDYFNTKKLDDKIYIKYNVSEKEYNGVIETQMKITNKWYRNYSVGDQIEISYSLQNPAIFQSNITLIHIVKGICATFAMCSIAIGTFVFTILAFRQGKKDRKKHMKKEVLVLSRLIKISFVILLVAGCM